MFGFFLCMSGIPTNSVKCFSYNSLRSATADFHPSSKIGGGGYGVVYKVRLTRFTLLQVFFGMVAPLLYFFLLLFLFSVPPSAGRGKGMGGQGVCVGENIVRENSRIALPFLPYLFIVCFYTASPFLIAGSFKSWYTSCNQISFSGI